MTVTTSVPEAPRPDTRETRALALYRARGAEIERIAPDVYLVPSCAGRSTYRVDLVDESCSCKDFEIRRENCKHILAACVTRAKRRGQSVPVHERIRRDAAAHPERTYSEHVAAARRIAGEQYREDLRRISPAAWESFHAGEGL